MADDIYADVGLIPIDSNLVTLSTTAFDGKIADALLRLSSAIAQNGLVLSGLVERVSNIESRVNEHSEKILRNATNQKSEMLESRRSVQDLGDKLELSVADTKAQSLLIGGLTHSLSVLEGRFTSVETGGNQTLNAHMSTIAGKAVSAGVSTSEMRMRDEIASSVLAVKLQMETFVQDESDVQQKVLTESISDARVEFEGIARASSESLRQSLREFRADLIGCFSGMEEKLRAAGWEARHYVSTVAAGFHSRLFEVVHGMGVLFSVLMLNPASCYSLCDIAQPNSSSNPSAGCGRDSSSVTLEAVLRKTESSEDMGAIIAKFLHETSVSEKAHWDESLAWFERRMASLEQFSRCTFGPDTNVSSSSVDLKVSYLAQLPQSVGMRFMMQKEVQDRVNLLRSELQHDMVTELLDVQRELKGKVAASKLSEIMEIHRDERLYDTVKSVVNDLRELRASKLDVQQFAEALKAKADSRALDEKVDTTELGAHVETLNRSADKTNRELTRVAEKARDIEANLLNLQQFVMSGGGVYTAVAELNEKLSSSAACSTISFGGVPVSASSPSWRPSRRSLSPVQSPQNSQAGVGSPTKAALTAMPESIGQRPMASKSASMLALLRKRSHSDDPHAETTDVGSVVISSPRGQMSLDGAAEQCSIRDDPEFRSADTSVHQKTPRRPLTGGSTPGRLARHSVSHDSRIVTGNAAINHHLSGGPLDRGVSQIPIAKGPSSVPMTASQKSYCDQLGLDSATTLRVLQAATPNVTTKEARGTRPL